MKVGDRVTVKYLRHIEGVIVRTEKTYSNTYVVVAIPGNDGEAHFLSSELIVIK